MLSRLCGHYLMVPTEVMLSNIAQMQGHSAYVANLHWPKLLAFFSGIRCTSRRNSSWMPAEQPFYQAFDPTLLLPPKKKTNHQA